MGLGRYFVTLRTTMKHWLTLATFCAFAAVLSEPLYVCKHLGVLLSSTILAVAQVVPAEAQTLSDEKIITLSRDPSSERTSKLGLKLKDTTYRGSVRVNVIDLQDDSPSAVVKNVKVGDILTEIDGINIEGLRVSKIGKTLKEKVDSNQDFAIKFRDPTAFVRQLDSRRPDAPTIVSSLLLPLGKSGGLPRDQRLVVERLEAGKHGRDDKVLEIGDVGEISFQLRVKDTGEIVDGVHKVEPPGSLYGGSKNMFFVVGSTKLPDNPLLGKDDKSDKDDILPPKWDLALRGMGVDERRRIDIPPVLRGPGYAPKKSLAGALKSGTVVEGDLRSGNLVTKQADSDTVDPLEWVSTNKDSDLELDVRLLSINGER